MATKQYTKSNSARKNYRYADQITVAGGGGTYVPVETIISATNATVTDEGVYRVYKWTGSGSFTVTQCGPEALIEYLVCAGGGGSGSTNGSNGGQGGGGGVLHFYEGAISSLKCIGPSFRVSNGEIFTVTVGASNGGTTNNSLTFPGSNSIISSANTEVKTLGGGGGGAGYSSQGLPSSGASAGGVGDSLATTFTTTTGPFTKMWSAAFKQGSDNNGSSGGPGGALTMPAFYTTGRTGMGQYLRQPGIGLPSAFGGTFQVYGAGGRPAQTADYTIGVGTGGCPKNASSVARYGTAGQVIIRHKIKIDNPIVVSGVQMLAVGGGAGSTISKRSGGGAGGLVYYGSETPKTPNGTTLSLPAGTYTVIIGAGGPSVVEYYGHNGGATTFNGIPSSIIKAATTSKMNRWDIMPTICAYGGGSYPGYDYLGGGQGAYSNVNYGNFAGIADEYQGKDGGSYTTLGGGGGGAGSAGANGTASKGGDGGNGLQYSISGTATYYAGGGGAYGTTTLASRGLGGLGGGGTAAYTAGTSGGAGGANTGGGAGGSSSSGAGSPGGSGILILRYPDSYPAATSTTGSPTITVAGGWRTYIFTQSGTITF